MTFIGIHIFKTWPQRLIEPLALSRRNIQTKHQGIRQTAYTTLLRPQLEYASPIWSSYTQAIFNTVEPVQRRQHAVSQMTIQRTVVWPLGWRSLEQRHADARLIMFYKIVNGLVAIPLPTYIQHQVRMTRTVHPMHFIEYKLLLTIINTPSSLRPLYSGTIFLPRLSFQFRPVICSLNHTMPLILRKCFYQLLTFY